MVGGLVNDIASASRNAELALSPLGRLIGEPDFGQRTRLLLSAFEGSGVWRLAGVGNDEATLAPSPQSATPHPTLTWC